MHLSRKWNEEVRLYMSEWEQLSEAIRRHHENRTGQAQEPTERGIALYEKLLVHCGGQLQPVNNEERLAFIRSSPNRFAAYRQLDALFTELHKQIAAKRIQLQHAKTRKR